MSFARNGDDIQTNRSKVVGEANSFGLLYHVAMYIFGRNVAARLVWLSIRFVVTF